MHNAHPVYRPDIDGLRAIAILSVVMGHAFPETLRGGFIGVDIFFVISGFLISSIIFRSLQRGDFSFPDFYARRARRIFPALSLVLVASYAYGWFVLLPDEFKQLGKQMAGGAGFVQNYVLSQEAGYFDTATELKPLMHLWSLSIEEQFYLLFPILIWGSWRLNLNGLILLVALALLSFGINIESVGKYAVQVFFMPHTRFWELLAGSVLAYMQLFRAAPLARAIQGLHFSLPQLSRRSSPEQRAMLLHNIFAGCGLFLITLAALGLHKGKPYPGGWALFPVLGACLLILAGPMAWLNRNILASRPMVYIGLVSYPLYLWHWPLLSFASIIEGATPSAGFRLALLAVSFILAWLTYQAIERPLQAWNKTRIKTTALPLLIGLLGLIGYNTYERDGLEFRLQSLTASEDAQLIQKISAAWRFKRYPEPQSFHHDPDYGYLAAGYNDHSRILFLGDSHAQQYWNTINAALEREKPIQTSIMFAELDFPPKIDPKIINDNRFKAVVFSYYWAYKYGSSKVDQSMRCCGSGKGGRMGVYNLALKTPAEMDVVDDDLTATIRGLRRAGKPVFIILDNAFGEEFDAHAKMSRSIFGNIQISLPPPLDLASAMERTEPVRSRLLKIAQATGSEVIDPMQYLCSAKVCPSFSDDGDLLYKDYDHLSLNASIHHVHYLEPVFERVQN
jgi:peptidoglycan/LPS O-acetylase OafA/YrhL